MTAETINAAIEAILFANGSSVEPSRIATALEISEAEAKERLEALMNEYQRFKKDYPDEIYSQFPLYALQLLHQDLL